MFAARAIVDLLFAGQDELLPGLYLVGWSLVPLSMAAIAIAATKAHLRMEYDALFGGLRPVLLMASAIVARAVDDSVSGLFAAWLVAHTLVAVFSLWPLVKHFDMPAVLRAIVRPRPHRAMLAFAFPQSLNLTLNRYITRLSVLMLAGMGFNAVQVAWYGTAAMLTSNLKTIRTVFSGALAPVAARHHQSGEREALGALLGRLSGLTTTLIVPLVLALVVLRDDAMALADPSYRGDSLFVAVLLIPPFINCAYGLAGNCLMFTGHSGWTLANSLAVALLNTWLNWLLIPAYGLLGGAIATTIAVALVSAAQLVELRALEGLTLRWRDVLAPHLALAAGLVVLAACWDPAQIVGLPLRIALALALVALSVGSSFVFDRSARELFSRVLARLTRRAG